MNMDKVCYWDSEEGVQKERDCTTEEQAEIDERRANAPLIEKQMAKQSIQSQIDALEQSIFMSRVMREKFLSDPENDSHPARGKIQGIDAQIESLREQYRSLN
jgi:hypothetical protein